MSISEFLDRPIPGFKQSWRSFLKSKSNWTALSGIATGTITYLNGTINLETFVAALFLAASLISVKDSNA